MKTDYPKNMGTNKCSSPGVEFDHNSLAVRGKGKLSNLFLGRDTNSNLAKTESCGEKDP